MRVLGIDCDSKKIAITIFDDGKLSDWKLIESKQKFAQDRTFELYKLFRIVIKSLKPDFVGIEESLFLNNFNSSKILTEVISFCKLVCFENNIPFKVIYNTSWKKEIIGKGNASKQEIADWVLAKYPKLAGEKQDILDSVGIGLYGVNHLGGYK